MITSRVDSKNEKFKILSSFFLLKNFTTTIYFLQNSNFHFVIKKKNSTSFMLEGIESTFSKCIFLALNICLSLKNVLE
jgi:hypothetical protein